MEATTAYRSILDLTHKMLVAATAQDWDTLISLESQRSALAAKLAGARMPAPEAEKRAIATIILDIERESAEIVERLQQWREDVRILLRIPNQ